MRGFEDVFAHLDRVCTIEARASVIGGNTYLSKAFFSAGGNWVSKGALEFHQFRPLDASAAALNAFVLHASQPIHQIACANQHLLRIAAAKRACSTKWTGIDDGDLPACR